MWGMDVCGQPSIGFAAEKRIISTSKSSRSCASTEHGHERAPENTQRRANVGRANTWNYTFVRAGRPLPRRRPKALGFVVDTAYTGVSKIIRIPDENQGSFEEA